MLSSTLLSFLFPLLSLVNAVPVSPVQYIAFAPTITSPSAGVVWGAGSTQTVSWLTNNVPADARNYTLSIVLGYFANDSENLDNEHPLASDVPIMQGSVQVTVPSDTPYGTNYTVAVIGDSGNVSPCFTITP